jgi:hypothetical protein
MRDGVPSGTARVVLLLVLFALLLGRRYMTATPIRRLSDQLTARRWQEKPTAGEAAPR